MEKQKLLSEYGEIKTCFHCGNWAVITDEVTYEQFEKENVELHHFPVFTCLGCKERTYSPIEHLTIIEKAKRYYQKNGSKIINCNEL